MHMRPFELERWYVEYEFTVKHNISASCAAPTTTADLLRLGGPGATERYLNLNLDYIENPGSAELRSQIARWFPGLQPGDIQVTAGASEAIFLLMNTLLDPGDSIIVEDPIYQSLHEVARSIGVRVKPWILREENGFIPDLDDLEALIEPSDKMVVINHPHSPTGAMLTRSQQRRLGEITARHGLILVSDEVYSGIVYDSDDDLPPAASVFPHAVSIGDITKAYGLGGLRIGWIATRNRDILKQCSAMRDYTTMCSAAPSEFLAAIALEHRPKILNDKISIARRNIDAFKLFVTSNADLLSWVPPRGGFTAFPKYHLNLSSRAFCSELINRKNVLLLPGDTFGRDGHFRIGFGKPNQEFMAGLSLFGEFLGDVRRRGEL